MTQNWEKLGRATDLDALRTGGVWGSLDPDTIVQGAPVEAAGRVFVVSVTRDRRLGNPTWLQTVDVMADGRHPSSETFERTLADDIGPWVRRSVRPSRGWRRDHELAELRSRHRHGGGIPTGGRTPISLSFDHGLRMFRDHILPALTRLGLPATLAVCSSDMDAEENEGVSFADVDRWALASGLEVANHGQSHADHRSEAAAVEGVLDSLRSLEAALPSLVVDAWIQPGIGVRDSWHGWNDGDLLQKFSSHPVGRCILANHAVATGVLGGMTHLASGSPIPGARRVAIDERTWLEAVEAGIPRLRGAERGMLIYAHPSLLGQTGYVTVGRLIAFLESLARRRDAGDIEVLTVSGFGWASPGLAGGVDLLDAGTRDSRSATVDLGERAPWARGGQWMIRSHDTATRVLIRDDTGALSVDRALSPGGAMVVTIPRDSRTLTCWTEGGASLSMKAV